MHSGRSGGRTEGPRRLTRSVQSGSESRSCASRITVTISAMMSLIPKSLGVKTRATTAHRRGRHGVLGADASDGAACRGSSPAALAGRGSDKTTKSMREELMGLAKGLNLTVRNVATHTREELTEQEGMEQLGAYSHLARLLDKCTVAARRRLRHKRLRLRPNPRRQPHWHRRSDRAVSAHGSSHS